jgi:Gram-negative bacterial TonB protein C-terminal
MAAIFTAVMMLALAQVPTTGDAQTSAPPSAGAMAASTRWQVDYGREQCRAVRSYGNGDDMVALSLARGADLSDIYVSIVGSAVPRQPALSQITLQFDEEPYPRPIYAESWLLNDRLGRVVTVRQPLSDIGPRLASARSMRFTLANGRTFHLQLTSLSGVLGHLETCHGELLTDWGVDMAAMRALRVPPLPINPERWIINQSFPNFSGRASAAVLLDIDADGVVVQCRTLDGSGVAEIDQETCRQLRARARFTPAIGSDGLPSATQVMRRVQYATR